MPSIDSILKAVEMNQKNQVRSHGFWGIFRIGLFFVFCGCCFLISGCLVDGSKPIWSAEVRSPDGLFVATARTYPSVGFINGTNTFVYLNWSTGSQAPMVILSLSDGSDEPADTVVDMKWLSPTHLELTYDGQRDVGFRAAKYASVNVTVQDHSYSVKATTRQWNAPPAVPTR